MNNDFNITLPTYDDVSDTYFIESELSDFATILGADSKGFSSIYWCKYDFDNYHYHQFVNCIDYDGNLCQKSTTDESISIRPALNSSAIEKYAEVVEGLIYDKFIVVKFGEYPQKLATIYDNEFLEKEFKANKMHETGKVYTTDSPFYDFEGIYVERDEFIPYQHIEYEYNGRKYIRVDGFFFPHNDDEYAWLLDYKDDALWIEVKPIHWIVNKDLGLAISYRALLSGIKYNYIEFDGEPTKCNRNLNFERTTMYRYLNTYFKKEIIPKELLHEFDDNIIFDNNSYNDIVSRKFK